MEETSTQSTQTPKNIDYNIVCQIVGHLYIELHNSRSSLDGNYSNIIENLTTQISELIEENESLKETAESEAATSGLL